MPLTNEQLFTYLQGLHVTEKEWRDAVLVLLTDLKKSNREQVSGRPSFQQMAAISATVPYILDYRDRKHVYIYSANPLTLSLEDLGTLAVSANTWTDISFRPGLYIYAQGQANTVYVDIVQTDETKAGASSGGGGGGGGTQYTDGTTPPAQPVGNALVFDNSGTWNDVGMDAGFPTQVLALPSIPAGTSNIGHVTVDNSNPNGYALSGASSPVVLPLDQNPASAVLNGSAYSVSSAFQTNGAAGNFPFSVFNPVANTKNILIFSIVVCILTVGGPFQINATTVDPAYGTNPVPLNQKLGGPASSLTTSISYTTATQTLGSAATFLQGGRLASNAAQELLTDGRVILLPKAAANGITIFTSPTGAGQWMTTVCYLEF